MRPISRPAPRTIDRRRPAARLWLEALEGRSLPSFGFGSAFGIGGSLYDGGRSIAKDAAGNTYLAGSFSGQVNFNPLGQPVYLNGGNFDGFVAEYAPDGTLLWATDVGSVGGGGVRIGVQGGSVYAAYPAGTGPYNLTVTRLNAADGTAVWTAQPVSGVATPNVNVAVGPSGNVYVTGVNASSQAVVDKLDPSGNLVWSQTSSGGTAKGNGVAVDASDNVYVTGGYTGTVKFGGKSLTSLSGSQDIFVWKLTAAGGSAWAGSMGSIGDDDSAISGTGVGAVAVDGAGNVLVTGAWGESQTYSVKTISRNNDFDPGSGVVQLANNGGDDVFVVKLSPNADGSMRLAWARSFGGPSTISGPGDWGMAVTADAAGNAYTVGSFSESVDFDPGRGTYVLQSAGGRDAFVSKLDANGNFVAAADLGGSLYDDGSGLAVDGGGNVWAIGSFRGTADLDPTAGTYNLVNTGASGTTDAFVVMLTQTSPQLAVGRGPGVNVVPLTQSQLSAAQAVAMRAWTAAGLPAADLARMRVVKADIMALSSNRLGAAALNGTEIAIDATADGWGWSVDVNAKPAAGRMDLLTVVMHELGHVVGLDSRFAGDPHDLMYAYLAPGERRLPRTADGVSAVHPTTTQAPSAEDRIDWLAAAATLTPKGGLLADWLADRR